MDTIFAPATPRAPAGLAVVRVSGPLAFSRAGAMVSSLPPPRQAALRTIRGRGGEVLDEGLVVAFESGASFTGEDVVEFHLHGSVAVIDAVLDDLRRRPGLRLAEPGEFTRRALENGRLDLTQVEGLSDLIAAETQRQRHAAQTLMSGSLSRLAETWRTRLIEAAALVEVGIDFSDEDVPDNSEINVRAILNGILAQLRLEAAGVDVAERLRDGFEVAIVGRPNAGKSTLLNSLAGRDVAITSDLEGTTRDVIEVHLDLGGLPVTVLDMAGIRDAGEDAVEALGVDRARQRAEHADLRVFLKLDAEEPPVALRQGDITLQGRGDERPPDQRSISGVTGAGVPELLDAIRTELSARTAHARTATRLRHKRAIEIAIEELECAWDRAGDRNHPEMTAEHLRAAIRALDSLVGRVDVEHILDDIFMRFCLGK